ncbi:MAG: alpha/beta fold hydrolase [Acidimicrobiia bacterium]
MSLVVAVVAVACDDDQPGAGHDGEISWSDCDDGFECGSLQVPRDYDNPRSGTITVALIRHPATDPAGRIGSLLVNPGGPGASGVHFVRGATDLLPEELRVRFDIVGFDPRGTGATLPIECDFDLDDVFALDTSPDDEDERAELEETFAALAAACDERSGADLAAVSSQDTVRDMYRIRAALGDDKLTYLGYSYGSYLGALYADQFPQLVRSMLLDGAVDPSLEPAESAVEQAVGFERALNAFLADCAETTIARSIRMVIRRRRSTT